MDISRLTPVYEAGGPFATVTLDVSHDSETAAREHELRVRDAGSDLDRQGAPEAVIRAVTDPLAENPAEPAPQARTVVGNRDGVRFDELVHRQVDQAAVSWSALPDLAGWVRLAQGNIRFVLALVDHVGGDVAVYRSEVPEPEFATTAGGETYHVHKVPVGGWSALRYQHETENVWRRNADAVGDEVESRVREGVKLVLVAGDARSVSHLLNRLEKVQATVVRLDSGGRADDGGGEAMRQAIREALQEYAVARQLELVHRLKDRLGQGFAVATGVRDVADAFVQGQVETLLLDPDGAADHELLPKDHPGLVLGDVPEDEAVRADQALLAAAALTSAEVTALPLVAIAGTPAAALLRWDNHES
ncbi:hypothetical protein FB561_3604 [Kribbella amoyensis]|uniref:Peptide subunit release factor 1 (ERF1) n=1 Tax=Kribbella amoyensis TaxID=996641 RepID=A0A561BUI8_9ACTN|nr:Vms1/Ankzf1 family peptidyl-tRNA hydrolase [Kribbella amoyensis]TWD82471.1 hypothetical protein FB561_3604 [Kribbella amoyensis]